MHLSPLFLKPSYFQKIEPSPKRTVPKKYPKKGLAFWGDEPEGKIISYFTLVKIDREIEWE
jgi:hypothetical protein